MSMLDNKELKIGRHRTVAVTHTNSVCLSKDQLAKLLDLPAGATISVDVPGGGDWSNTTLEVGEFGVTLNIEWED